ncbi:Ankyrin [Turneriella parva DSM 21527]|uniref:Ankyrin n=2 Tax=Turneriella TaxID=338321 RepID=I4B3K7_TURPD|nr:Ankyrin [Turneriella parva DSM 21527]
MRVSLLHCVYSMAVLITPSLFAAPEEALRAAAEAADPVALEAALKKKPNVNAPLDEYGQTALFLVIGQESKGDDRLLKCTKLLISAGADVNQRAFSDQNTPLLSLISPYSDRTEEHRAIIEVLAAAGADLNASSKDGSTAMSRAIQRVDLDTMKKLIALGAEMNPVLPEGRNYVHLAARLDMDKRGVDKALEILINAGVDFDTPDERDRTPLHYIAESGNEAALKQILKYKPRIDRKDNEGKTPVDLALRKKGISETPGYEQHLAKLIRRSANKPKLIEVGEIFSASEAQVDIMGKGIGKVKSGQKLTVRTAQGGYTLVAGENMHTKLKAKASPAAAVRLKKGDKVYRK